STVACSAEQGKSLYWVGETQGGRRGRREEEEEEEEEEGEERSPKPFGATLHTREWIESSRARGPNTRHKSGGGLGNPSLEELIYTLELNFLELTLNKKWESRKANHEPDARRTLLREAMNVSQQRFD
ncbi:unnamed protein product, partial [Prorocentrum cordatum]